MATANARGGRARANAKAKAKARAAGKPRRARGLACRAVPRYALFGNEEYAIEEARHCFAPVCDVDAFVEAAKKRGIGSNIAWLADQDGEEDEPLSMAMVTDHGVLTTTMSPSQAMATIPQQRASPLLLFAAATCAALASMRLFARWADDEGGGGEAHPQHTLPPSSQGGSANSSSSSNEERKKRMAYMIMRRSERGALPTAHSATAQQAMVDDDGRDLDAFFNVHADGNGGRVLGCPDQKQAAVARNNVTPSPFVVADDLLRPPPPLPPHLSSYVAQQEAIRRDVSAAVRGDIAKRADVQKAREVELTYSFALRRELEARARSRENR